MGVIYFLLPISVVLAACGVWACIVAVRSGQYDDLDTPAMRIFFDDEEENLKKRLKDGEEEKLRKEG